MSICLQECLSTMNLFLNASVFKHVESGLKPAESVLKPAESGLKPAASVFKHTDLNRIYVISEITE